MAVQRRITKMMKRLGKTYKIRLGKHSIGGLEQMKWQEGRFRFRLNTNKL